MPHAPTAMAMAMATVMATVTVATSRSTFTVKAGGQSWTSPPNENQSCARGRFGSMASAAFGAGNAFAAASRGANTYFEDIVWRPSGLGRGATFDPLGRQGHPRHR